MKERSMWFFFAFIALVLVGIGCYIMPDNWDKGILLVTFSSFIFVLAIVPILLYSFHKNNRAD
jgi:uncharacterized Tic20 family protein